MKNKIIFHSGGNYDVTIGDLVDFYYPEFTNSPQHKFAMIEVTRKMNEHNGNLKSDVFPSNSWAILPSPESQVYHYLVKTLFPSIFEAIRLIPGATSNIPRIPANAQNLINNEMSIKYPNGIRGVEALFASTIYTDMINHEIQSQLRSPVYSSRTRNSKLRFADELLNEYSESPIQDHAIETAKYLAGEYGSSHKKLAKALKDLEEAFQVYTNAKGEKAKKLAIKFIQEKNVAFVKLYDNSKIHNALIVGTKKINQYVTSAAFKVLSLPGLEKLKKGLEKIENKSQRITHAVEKLKKSPRGVLHNIVMQKMRGVKSFILADGLYASAIFRMNIRAKMLIRVPLVFDLTIATTATIATYRSGGDWQRTALEEYGGILFGGVLGFLGGVLGTVIGSPVVGAIGAISGAVLGDKLWKAFIKITYENEQIERGLAQ